MTPDSGRRLSRVLALVSMLVLFLSVMAGCPKRHNGTGSEMVDTALPTCDTLVCLKQHEGLNVRLEGTYLYPAQQAFAVNELRLRDDSVVIINAPRKGEFTQANHNKRLAVTGRIFTGEIPEKYDLIGRRPEPYLVDVSNAEVL